MRRLDGDRLRGAVYSAMRARSATSCYLFLLSRSRGVRAGLGRSAKTTQHDETQMPQTGVGGTEFGHLQRPSCARAVRLGGGGRRRGDAHRDGADLDGKGGGQNRSRSRPLTPAEVSQRTGPRVWGSRKRVGRPSPRIKSRAAPINDDGLILRTFLSKG